MKSVTGKEKNGFDQSRTTKERWINQPTMTTARNKKSYDLCKIRAKICGSLQKVPTGMLKSMRNPNKISLWAENDRKWLKILQKMADQKYLKRL